MFIPRVQPNDVLRKKRSTLYILLGAGIILLFPKFFIDVNLAVNGLIILILLWCGISQLNYCLLAFFVIISLLGLLSYISFAGIFIQTLILSPDKNNKAQTSTLFTIFIITLSIVYNITACWYCYDAYKIFKYETIKGIGMSSENQEFVMKNKNEENKKGQDFTAFQGTGVKIG